MRCDLKKTPQGGGGEISVTPAKSAPGETILLARSQGKFDRTTGLQVTFGKTVATVIGVNDLGHLEVLVPMAIGMAEQGSTTISLTENGKSVGRVAFEIQPATAKQLILEMNTDGRLRLVSDKPYGGGYDQQFSTRTFQLSYDIMAANGNLLFSASIAHPVKERAEVFENPEGSGIHREGKESPSVFPVKIPNLKEAVVIRFYEASARMDLTTPEGRRGRKFLSEIKLR